ncbi:MAG: glycosyltransferase involved in cell wall biosynthesis [Sediminicola sp.]|jgi:glycosyltransferase involved in cell wall biosynthesis|tara:strand:+ start:1928 stop:2818 length:891 start_codon:yes stop_codon:yes gene_type:complete
MLSILIPTYNYKVLDLVKELHSQIEFFSDAVEIIVIDDCSKYFITDNESINKLTKCSYTFSEKNNGRTATRSKLASLAKFEWLLFLDADIRPKRDNFIKEYLSYIQDTVNDVVFGGISYQEERPTTDQLLRWVYGKAREAKSVKEREKSPYFIISQNLLIKKETFLAANTVTENYYGLDNYFSNQLKRQNAKVGHIDNPVIHLGLETNSVFITKALKAVETTVIFEDKGLMDTAERPLQKSYLKLKSFGLAAVFNFTIYKLKGIMERNFLSGKPNLFWFDLYRLSYYIDLKNGKDA